MDARVFQHAWTFYRKKLLLVVLFSIPFIAASLITMLVSAPSYLAVGSVFIRTGSMPEMNTLDVLITIISYLVSIFIISYVLTNLNLLVKEKRTQTRTKGEILRSVRKYTLRIFFLLVILKLITLALQLGTYGSEHQDWLYPLLLGIFSLAFFFVPAAIVIDERDSFRALKTSIKLVLKKPVLVFAWIILGTVLISILELLMFYLTGPVFGAHLTMLFNSLFILPFLIILQSHIYMERYPLAK